MHQLQSSSDHATVVNTDRKTSPDITPYAAKDPESINMVDHAKQLSSTQKARLDKAVIWMSTWRTLFMSIVTISAFAGLLILGLKYKGLCPIQPLLSAFLIVHGCGNLVQGIVLFTGFITAHYIKRSPSPSPYARYSLSAILIAQLVCILFSIGWWLVGQVWVFGALANGFQSSNANQTTTYCNAALFWNSFADIIVTYAISLILLVVYAGRFLMKCYKIKQEAALKIDGRI